MKNKYFLLSLFIWAFCSFLTAQHISEFTSLSGSNQTTDFRLPDTHTFQYIIEEQDALTEGGILPDVTDFAGYVPIDSSSKFGYLSINSETAPGGVTILDIEFNDSLGKWIVNNSEAVNFSFGLFLSNIVGETIANCSGTVTPWNTIITCEEVTNKDLKKEQPSTPDEWLMVDGDINGYNGYGWAIEIDPKTKKVIDQDGGRNGSDKLWAMGNFKHENAVVHQNRRTVYQGADDTNGEGYLFKFIADEAEDLSSGALYVYIGDKSGNGDWIQLDNNTISEQNSTLEQCANKGATNFGGIEDVEIDPIDGMIYFAVKREDLGSDGKKGVVYRFNDSDPLDDTGITDMEIYVGNQSYDGVDWGDGNDNLVFDNLGNLWVAQDESGSGGQRNYIWVVDKDHTQLDPKVKIFAQAPYKSEPTGLTFSPDYKYLFMSIQHPDSGNTTSNQPDAFGDPKTFDKDVTLVISLKENLNANLLATSEEIMISQYYEDEASNSKWVEVKNISNKIISAGSYFLGLYDQNDLNNMTITAPTMTEPIPEMDIDAVILFKNTGASLPINENLGNANQIETAVCDFDGDDVILISSTPGNISHTNRRDIIGEDGIWGMNTNYIKGGNNSGIPDKIFDMNNWMVLTKVDTDTAYTNTNLALGTHEIGASEWDGSNWNNSTIPDKTRNVEINGNYSPTIGGLTAYNLTINSPFGFDNGSGESILVFNDLSINDEFVIGDTESLVMYNKNAVITGIIEKNESSTLRNNAHDITYWTSSVENETIENVFSGVNPNRIFYFDQTKSIVSDPDNDPDGTYWDVWQIANNSMIPGEGYAAEGPTGETGIHNISFSGAPNNGDIFYTLKGNFGDGDPDNDFNLIGNPYPSAIDIDLFFETNADYLDPEAPLNPEAYFWTHTTEISNGNSGDFVSSDYATYNLTGGTGVGIDPPTSNIGSGQGFFVRAINPGEIEFNNSMRIVNKNQQFFKSNVSKKTIIEKDRIWLNLTTDQGGFNQILIGFDKRATNGIDRGFDTTPLKRGNPIIFYSLIENKKFVIQGLSSFTNDQIIGLGMETKSAPRNFTISIAQLEGELKETNVYLVDHELNIIHNLKLSDYQFEQIITGDFSSRFSLQFTNSALDVSEQSLENNFTISNSIEGLEIKGSKVISKIEVYDILGKLLIKNDPNKQNFILKTNNIKKGTLLIVRSTFTNGIVLSKKTITY